MTEMLEKAIAELRSLPESEHDWAADNVRFILSERERGPDYELTPEQIEEIKQTVAELDSGRMQLLSVEETEEMWRRLGV